MHLHAVRLRNIRSYQDQTITFAPGLTLLCGDIGAGKSSVLLAIEFALFGIVRGSLDGEALLRHGAGQGSVELSMRLDGKDVTIIRSLKRIKDEVRQDAGSLTVDGQRIIGTAIELKAKMLELLGYPKDALTRSKALIYRYTVYTPQEEMRAILGDGQEQRAETLRRIFGVDRYQRAQEGAGMLMRRLREERLALAAKAEGLSLDKERRDQLRVLAAEERAAAAASSREAQLLGERISALRALMVGLEERRARAQDAGQALAIASEALKAEQARLARAQQSLSQADQSLQDLRSQRAALGIIAFDAQALEGAQADLERARVAHESARTGYAAAQAAYEGAQAQKAALLADIAGLRAQLTRRSALEAQVLAASAADPTTLADVLGIVQDKIADARAIIARSAQVMEQGTKHLSQLHEASTCPLCQQHLSQAYKDTLLGTQETLAKRAGAEHAQAQKTLAGLQAELKALTAEHRAALDLAAQAPLLKRELIALEGVAALIEQKEALLLSLERAPPADALVLSSQADLKRAQEAFARLTLIAQASQQTIALDERIKAYEAQKVSLSRRLAEAQEALSAAQMARSYAEAALVEIGDPREELRAASAALQALLDEEKALIGRQAAHAKQAESLALRIEQAGELISAKERYHLEAQQRAQLQEWLGALAVPLFSLMERHVLARVHREFNDYFRAWFSMLMGDEAISARLSADFSPIIEQNGYETTIENLSGGEKTSCALAYRLALTKAINDTIPAIKTKGLLILDEPTDGFSSEQLDRMREVLARLQLRQVIIVSHEAKIEGFVDHVVRIRKGEHVSLAEVPV